MTALSPDDETTGAELAPRRLLDGGAGEHERHLLAAARLDRVPPAAKARVAAALGGVIELQASPRELEFAGRGAPPSQSGTRTGLGVLGAGVVGALALSLWLQATPGERSNPASTAGGPVLESEATAAQSGDAPLRGASARPSSSPWAAEAAENPTAAAPAGLSQQATQPPRLGRTEPPHRRKRTDTAHDVDSGLLAEVRALEAVSSAIAAAELGRAARELEAYRRRFARGELAIEADVLAIQIAIARGDEKTATAGAERLLARPEAEHYRARVQALLERKTQPPLSTDREKAGRHRSNEPEAHIRARR
jgi:hypothetical protein